MRALGPLAFLLLTLMVADALPIDAAAPALPRAQAACGRSAAPTMILYLPNITKTLGGPSGWVTPFIVQNIGSSATALDVSFFSFGSGDLVTCRTVADLAPGTSFADVPNGDGDLPDNTQFSVVVRSFGAPVVAVVNEHQGSGTSAEALSYLGLSEGSTEVYVPYLAKKRDGWLTTLIIQNVGTASAAVSIRLLPYASGAPVTLSRSIAPGRSSVVDPLVEPLLAEGAEYSAVLSSDRPIGVVANAHNDAPGVAAPMGFSYNGTARPAGSTAYLPYLSRGSAGGGRPRLYVQNAGRDPATPLLKFRAIPGNQLVQLAAPSAIEPGRTWAFDPQSCPGGQACLGVGEHSLVVEGGSFAVLNGAVQTKSASGHSASSAPTRRSYLPNVTRRLGGASGWTTPVVLQSAGATEATLRWSRFADGAVVRVQQLQGLAPGASSKLDPRQVAGLVDEGQYAVVVDANGPIVAMVNEVNSQGGDGEMAYEGIGVDPAFGLYDPGTPSTPNTEGVRYSEQVNKANANIYRYRLHDRDIEVFVERESVLSPDIERERADGCANSWLRTWEIFRGYAFPYYECVFSDRLADPARGSSGLAPWSRHPSTSLAADTGRWRYLLAHEIFHAWNYGHLNFEDLWINEGMAEYYVLFIEPLATAAGPSGQLGVMADGYRSLLQRGHDMPLASVTRDNDSLAYSKGMLIFYMLDIEISERTAGAKSFNDVLRRLYMQNGPKGFPPGIRPPAWQRSVLLDAIVAEAGGREAFQQFFADFVEGARDLFEWRSGWLLRRPLPIPPHP